MFTDCERIAKLLSAYTDRELSPDETRAVRTHLAACSRCYDEYEALLAIKSRIQCMVPAEPPEGFSDEIMAAIRSGAGQGRASYLSGFRRSWGSSLLAAATVAVLLVSAPLGVMALLKSREDQLRTADYNYSTVVKPSGLPAPGFREYAAGFAAYEDPSYYLYLDNSGEIEKIRRQLEMVVRSLGTSPIDEFWGSSSSGLPDSETGMQPSPSTHRTYQGVPSGVPAVYK